MNRLAVVIALGCAALGVGAAWGDTTGQLTTGQADRRYVKKPSDYTTALHVFTFDAGSICAQQQIEAKGTMYADNGIEVDAGHYVYLDGPTDSKSIRYRADQGVIEVAGAVSLLNGIYAGPSGVIADFNGASGNYLPLRAASPDNALAIGPWLANTQTMTNTAAHALRWGHDNLASWDGFANVKGALYEIAGGAAFDGGSGQYLRLQGVISTNVTNVGNGADTTEDDLMTYTLPANVLDTNGRGVRITAMGTLTSGTANTQTVRCKFGGTTIANFGTTGTPVTTPWRIEAEVYRTGASSEVASGDAWFNNGGTGDQTTTTALVGGGALSVNTANTIIIKCTGQRATTSSANSIVQYLLSVEVLN